MLLHGRLEEVRPWIPGHLGVCEAVGPDTTRVRSSTSNLDYFVLRVSDHPFAMTVEEPADLRAAFARSAQRMAATAGAAGDVHRQPWAVAGTAAVLTGVPAGPRRRCPAALPPGTLGSRS